jgi:hypothetical protein
MSQVLDLASPPISDVLKPAPASNRDITPIVVLGMLAIGVALSLISLALPDWVFQPYDLTAFPLS